MDSSTAEAISVIEKQMAEKDAKIAALENTVAALQRAANDDAQRLAVLERAASAFSKGLVR